jgi:hypothetical protein
MNEQELRRHAARHGGYLTIPAARELGCGDRQIAVLLREYGWTRPQIGALAPPGSLGDPALVRLRAVLEQRPHLVASHRTAAALHGVSMLFRPGEAERLVELTDPRTIRARTRIQGMQVHRLPLVRDEIVVRQGVRCTALLRTLADVSRSESRNAAVAALDSGLNMGLCTVEELRGHLVAASGRHGSAAALSLLDLADGRSESPLETEARLLMHDAGWHPRPQAEVATARGPRRVDFLFDAEGLAVETDGAEHHASADGQRRDLRRFNDLAGCAQVRAVLRFSWQDIFLRPDLFLREVGEKLALLA